MSRTGPAKDGALTPLGGYGWLALAIAFEVVATSFLKMADGFTRPLPSVVVALGYALAFYCLSMALRSIPVGIAYAVWCGIGILLVTAVAWILYDQHLDGWALTAIGLILAGTLMLHMCSPTGG